MLSLMDCIQQAMSCLELTLQKQSPRCVTKKSGKKIAKSTVAGLETYKFSGCGIYIDPKL